MERIYRFTKIVRFEDLSDFYSKQIDIWKLVAHSARLASHIAREGVYRIELDNEGLAVDALREYMNRSDSSSNGLDALSDAAMRTAVAYETAAEAHANGRKRMDEIAQDCADKLTDWSSLAVTWGPAFVLWTLADVKGRMEEEQRRALDIIQNNLAAVMAPEPLVSPDDMRDVRGIVPEEIQRIWDDLSAEERKAVARLMVEEVFEENRLFMPNIDFDYTGGNGRWVTSQYTLQINKNYFDPSLKLEGPSTMSIFHVVAHESRHALQAVLMDIYRRKDEGEIEKMKTRWEDDEFRPRGLTVHEVERMRYNRFERGYQEAAPPKEQYASERELDEKYATYVYQPLERDAHRMGRRYIDMMNEEDFRELVERATGRGK